MHSAPFRDSTSTLLRRIDELERANRRLRKKSNTSLISDIAAAIRLFCRLFATLFCVVGILLLAFMALAVAMFVMSGVMQLL
ncbi:MAG: hypothetical protein ACRELY_06345 [Polyangiaceae bacterium]